MRAGKQSLAGAAMIVAPALALVGLAGPAAASLGRAMPSAVAAGQPDSTTIKVGGHPTAIAVDGQAGLVWVADGDHVVKINAVTRRVVGSFPVVAGLTDIAVDPRTSMVWVTDASSGTVTGLIEDTGSIASTIALTKGVTAIAYNDFFRGFDIINPGQDSLVDVSGDAGFAPMTTELPLSGAPVAVSSNKGKPVWIVGGQQAYNLAGFPKPLADAPDTLVGVAEDPTTKFGPFVGAAGIVSADPSNPDTGTLFLLNNRASEFEFGRVSLKSSPDAIAIDSHFADAWITSGTASQLTLVNLRTEKVARTLPTGADPVAVADDAANRTVWTANSKAGTVTMYHYAAPRFTTKSLVDVEDGQAVRFTVHAAGFPEPDLRLLGELPAGVHARRGGGSVEITGTPRKATAHHTYTVVITADNGIGVRGPGSDVSQNLVIKVS